MTRQEQIERIIHNCLDGLETLRAATSKLDALKVRGGFSQHGPLHYTGYDYDAQTWVEVPSPVA